MSNTDDMLPSSPWEVARLERAQMAIGIITVGGVQVDRAALASDLVL